MYSLTREHHQTSLGSIGIPESSTTWGETISVDCMSPPMLNRSQSEAERWYLIQELQTGSKGGGLPDDNSVNTTNSAHPWWPLGRSRKVGNIGDTIPQVAIRMPSFRRKKGKGSSRNLVEATPQDMIEHSVEVETGLAQPNRRALFQKSGSVAVEKSSTGKKKSHMNGSFRWKAITGKAVEVTQTKAVTNVITSVSPDDEIFITTATSQCVPMPIPLERQSSLIGRFFARRSKSCQETKSAATKMHVAPIHTANEVAISTHAVQFASGKSPCNDFLSSPDSLVEPTTPVHLDSSSSHEEDDDDIVSEFLPPRHEIGLPPVDSPPIDRWSPSPTIEMFASSAPKRPRRPSQEFLEDTPRIQRRPSTDYDEPPPIRTVQGLTTTTSLRAGVYKPIATSVQDSPRKIKDLSLIIQSDVFQSSWGSFDLDKCLKPRVKFDRVEVREYERVIGDNPACTSGPPISIGWQCQSVLECPLDEYERHRTPLRRRKRDFHLSASRRADLLLGEWDFTETELRDARREATYIQYCREKAVVSCARKVHESKVAPSPDHSDTSQPPVLCRRLSLEYAVQPSTLRYRSSSEF